MKTITKQIMLLAILIPLMMISAMNSAQGEEFKKYVDRKFDVDKNATLIIKNKFGDIHCETWSEMKVSVKVEITVNASNQDKANKIFDRITVDVTGDRNRVTGETQIGSMSFNNAEFSIDYYVMMPKSMNVDLKNSFGEIFLQEAGTNCSINLEYGEFEAETLNGVNNQITMKFSEGSVEYMKEAKLNIEYSELDVEKAGSLTVRTRFSELNVDNMEELFLDSQYDDISIDNSGSVDIIARFSDVSIDRLNGNIKLDAQYGGFDADYIFAGFSDGLIDAAFTDVSLTFDPAASFNVAAEMKFCELSYPSSNTSIKHSEENYVTNIYNGIVGTNKSPSAKLVIESQNGDVSISF